MTLKEKASRLKENISAILLAYARKDLPLSAKIAAAATVAYALSPIDLVPDFIPVLGYLDDLIILPLMIALCIRLIPENIMSECREQAKNTQNTAKGKKWYYAIPVVIVWALIAFWILRMVFK